MVDRTGAVEMIGALGLRRPRPSTVRRYCAGLACLLLAVSSAARGFQSPPQARAHVVKPVTLSTPYLTFQVDPKTGSYQIRDKRGGTIWHSNPSRARFGEITATDAGKVGAFDLAQCEAELKADGLEIRFLPLPSLPQAILTVTIHPVADGAGLEFTYTAAREILLKGVRLLDSALWTTDAEQGYVLAPTRMGLMIPARHGVDFNHTFDTYAYEGCHMTMWGIVKGGATALVTWDDPYAAIVAESRPGTAGDLTGRQVLSTSLDLRETAKSFQIRFLGHGDYDTLAKAYRPIAAEHGWVVPWSEKLKGHEERAKLIGAINYKLWALLDREMDLSSTKEEVLKVNWTFDEAAQVAEHLKNDLKLDKVLFTAGGWTHRGYDNQHPDILPANSECGGDEALTRCARRVIDLGYLFCLHDNYQDIYRDSPSWSEDLIMKQPDGSLAKGGHWWGGQAYLTCSRRALDLAMRPQNLPGVKELTNTNAYFIDTTYAAGLQECYDPNHPLGRSDDMKWKQALSDYAREEFGVFGSEDGREWAIPHSDFFEGLTGVDGTWFHDKKLLAETGGVSVPLFELVYRDCIALYGKYGFDLSHSTDYVLYHLSIGRTLNYHEVPPHLYWKEAPQAAPADAATKASGEDPALFMCADHGWAEGLHPFDRFVKNTYEIMSPLNELTAELPMTQHRFLSADYKVQRSVFGEGVRQVVVIVNSGDADYSTQSVLGSKVVLSPGGFIVEGPTFAAFYAKEWNGLAYANPPLFTLRSEDGQPLERSGKVRVFHGFGDSRVKLPGGTFTVAKEEVVSVVPSSVR